MAYKSMYDEFDKLSLLSELTSRAGNDLVGNLHVFKSIDSTNQWMIRGIGRGVINNGDICIAEQQTSGKGRYGKQWQSPKNGSLYLSIACCKKSSSEDNQYGSLLAIGVALEIAEILKMYGLDHVRIKWPNDIILDEKKICGVLIERITSQGYIYWVVGMGINFGSSKSIANVIDNVPGSVSEYVTNWKIARNEILIKTIVRTLITCNSNPSYMQEKIINSWDKYDYLYEKPIIVRMYDGSSVDGIARGIGEDGALLLEINGSLRKLYSGDVSVRINASIDD